MNRPIGPRKGPNERPSRMSNTPIKQEEGFHGALGKVIEHHLKVLTVCSGAEEGVPRPQMSLSEESSSFL